MAELTKNKIRQFLRPFLNSLLAAELISLRTSLLTAKTEQNIPSPLRSALRLNEFLYPPHKIAEIILTEFDSLLEERCNSGKLVSEEHRSWIKIFITQWLVDHLVKPEETLTQITHQVKDLPQIDIKIACSHLKNVAKVAKETPEIFAKRFGNSAKLVLLVKHPIIILSSFKSQLEAWFAAFPEQIDEVHFVAQHLFMADCSLDQINWHGINISIICNKFEGVKNSDNELFLWNLSGQNGKNHDLVKAAQDQNGLDGIDGSNGGNLVIIANKFNALENLKVVCNAGSGGNGQHGGDGTDGQLGEEMSYAKLTTLFPPTVVSSKEGRQLIFKNAFDLTKGISRDKLLISPESAFDLDSGVFKQNVDESFVEGTTKNGQKVFVAFGSSFCTKYAICLVQGTPGMAGRRAGFGGSPGKPGQPGSVQFFNFDNLEQPHNPDDICIAEVQCKAGEYGRQGVDGVNGSTGELGKDVGYIFLNGKEIGKYQGGKYELICENQKTNMNIARSKLLGGMFLRIDSQISSPYNVAFETIFLGDIIEFEGDRQNSDRSLPPKLTGNDTTTAKHIFQLYGSDVFPGKLENWSGLVNDGKWWSQTIIELSENGN